MKTAKLIIGIISCVLFPLILLQSCAVGLSTSITNETNDFGGSAGILLGMCLLVAGITGIATRKSKGGGIATGIIYLLGALFGAIGIGGIFADIAIHTCLSAIFGAFFLIGSILMKSPKKKQAAQVLSDNGQSPLSQDR